MTSKDFSELLNEINKMSASEIAEVILFEDMADDQADEFQNAIPVEMVSEVMSMVE